MFEFGKAYLAIALMLLSSASYGGALERAENFALLDHEGVYHELRKYGDYKAVVFVSTSSECKATLDAIPKYRLLKTTWERQGIAFLAIDSSPSLRFEKAKSLDSVHRINLPILLDDSQLVAENLSFVEAGQIAVVEPARYQILYRGGLGESTELKPGEQDLMLSLNQILKAVVNDETSLLKQTHIAPVSGCPIDFSTKNKHSVTPPDYSADIVPIIQENCLGCHIEGGIAPFAMDSHTMIQGWSPMIREVLLTKRMPPAQVDPQVQHFENARYLEVKDLQTLIHWIDAGSPRGAGNDGLLQTVEPAAKWKMGKPDYIVNVPAFTVPATGVLDYENVTINLPFTDDVWVKSVQHAPGDRRVLHHLLSFIVPADYSERIVEGENDEYREFLEGYAPGKESAVTYPPDSGVFIPVGSAVQLSLHYTTFGKEVVDQTQIGLYFASSEPKHQYSTYSLSHGGTNLRIPPGEANHEMSASYVFEDEVVLHGLRPHMHYRGKSMRMSAVYPNGTREDLINVPDYSFAWQPTYRLSDPIILPAGSRVLIEGVFDNSQYNLGNPDPDAVVKGGAQSWDEMFIGYFSFYKTR